MSKILFIDSDDIEGLSEALREALERRGVVFGHSEYDYPDEDEPDIDPYLGNMPPFRKKRSHAEDHSDEKFLFQETGGVIPGSCGMRTYGSCGQPSSPSYGGCGGGGYYPRC
jgi:hypothetical protein